MRQEQLERLQRPETPPVVQESDRRVARMVKALEMEDYTDRLELEMARRARQVPADHQTSTSLTVTQHPMVVLPQQEVKTLPVTFVGGVGHPAPIVVPPLVSQSLPPQGLVLEDGARGEEVRLRDLRDNQLWRSRQDVVGSLAAPPFVPAAAQGLVHLPF